MREDVRVRALAAVLALMAVLSITLAIVGMVTGRPGERTGFALRLAALGCFGAAVALNVASR